MIQGTLNDTLDGLDQGCFASYSPPLISVAASVPSVIEPIKTMGGTLVLILQYITLI